ncbi:DUF2459 domain-containing protein [Qipengyuania sp. MTN3-11]|uniref:DUF2459 domain-containing protein n=1 Tax=Qipengyuania sp. MTN3-11 TaxID=3056557 RepID=UPI0036F35BF5
MAAQAPRRLKPWQRWGLGFVAAPFALVALALLAGWIGSAIPRNADWTEPDDGIEIMVATNGIHTELILPIVSPVKDWRETFPTAAQPRRDGQVPTHVAIGWGEKEVFLETPTWSDLKLATALRIATTGGEGLMRVGHYVRPAPDENHRPLRLRPAEYRRLVARVERTLPPLPPGATRRTYAGFMPEDANYDAAGKYTLANTCNQWTADTLAEAGSRSGCGRPSQAA